MINIAVDKAELVATLLEALLYGEDYSHASLLKFRDVLCDRFLIADVRRGHLGIGDSTVPKPTQLQDAYSGMLAVTLQYGSQYYFLHFTPVAQELFVSSVQHLVISIIRVVEGLVIYRDAFPDEPLGYFSDRTHWTIVSGGSVYAAKTLIGDGVILHRCYMAWQSKLVLVLPVLLWCGVSPALRFLTSRRRHACPQLLLSTVLQDHVFVGTVSHWITAFYALTFTTNLFTTILLVYRIWSVDRHATSLHGNRNSQLGPILRAVIDAGAIYSVSLLAVLIFFVKAWNGRFVVLDMITPIISITFYMTISRVGMINWNRRVSTFGFTSNGRDRNEEWRMHERTRMKVYTTTITERKFERDSLEAIQFSCSETTLTKVEDSIDVVAEEAV
ncbi:hypothetical protein BU15DRAFT_75407 [Melanogaster broomeanus]|nr:hypothetical protein BU15DRAFT_75407 [Melanogaster broomeanus]